MPILNPLLTRVELPPIPQAHGWAARYDGAHGAALDLCQAVPGWAPHGEMLARLAEAALAPETTRYGLIDGDAALREAHAGETSAVYGGRVGAEEVAITAGCNQAFFLAMLAVARAGDAVLLPVPWFWNHQQSCTMLGIEARALPCRAEDGFVPDPGAAAALLDERVRAIVLISPNNPTGAVYPPAVIEAFFELCRRRGIWLILDETYRDFLPAGQDRAHGLFARDDWAGTLIQLYSFSKAYCMPGARMGAATAGAGVVREFVKALDCLHICAQRPGQAAMAWGIGALGGWRAENRAVINGRAAAVRAAFAAAPGWVLESCGAYFAYVRHPFGQPAAGHPIGQPAAGHPIGQPAAGHPIGQPAAAVAERLASEFGAVCLPGPAFGPRQERHLRVAFANTDEAGLGELATRLRRMSAQR